MLTPRLLAIKRQIPRLETTDGLARACAAGFVSALCQVFKEKLYWYMNDQLKAENIDHHELQMWVDLGKDIEIFSALICLNILQLEEEGADIELLEDRIDQTISKLRVGVYDCLEKLPEDV